MSEMQGGESLKQTNRKQKPTRAEGRGKGCGNSYGRSAGGKDKQAGTLRLGRTAEGWLETETEQEPRQPLNSLPTLELLTQ
jgi:hypothetical protein